MPPDARFVDTIFKLASAIVQLEPGPLARLRRMRSDGPGTAEFWELALNPAHRLRTDTPGLRLVALMALLTPKGEPGGKRLHEGRISFGQALAATDPPYPERQLLRFLATPFAERPEALDSMARWLAAKGHTGVNCVDLACLLWFDDVAHERRLARAYFDELRKRSDKPQSDKKDDAA